MKTQFINNETIEDIKEISTDIKFTKGDQITIDDKFYEVESIHMNFDLNLMYVWLDDAT